MQPTRAGRRILRGAILTGLTMLIVACRPSPGRGAGNGERAERSGSDDSASAEENSSVEPAKSVATHTTSDARPGTDPATGMLMAEGWTTVRDHCVACHSPRQFLNQRGTRSTWLEIIRWMQEKAGLGLMTPENEARALDYLTTNFGPEEGKWRRAPIPPRLLPPNPYPSEIRRELETRSKESSG